MPDKTTYPSQLLQARIDRGELKFDSGQAQMATALDQLVDVIAARGRRSWIGGLLARRRNAGDGDMGLYIYGGVGRGKTMLMDMFYSALPEGRAHPRKWRLHFHDFMVLAQDLIHSARQKDADDPIEDAAIALADKGQVVCFDEMEVRDIADAMILARLFTKMLDRGVIVVATSNRHADDLYKNGLHRDRFLPFIELLKQRCRMVEIADGDDWRGAVLAQLPAWYEIDASAGGSKTMAALDVAFDELRAGVPVASETIKVAGRDIVIAKAAGDVAMVMFEDLCDVPLAARDYLAIAGRFAGLVMVGIPRFDERNEHTARRFMWLIDALYDRGRFIIASAHGPIDDLYHGHQFAFEFSRTMSRLGEMTRRGKSS